MPNYIKRQAPGSFVRHEKVVERIIEREKPEEPKPENPQLDVHSLANAVANALAGKIPQGTTQIIHSDGSMPQAQDSFDDSKTMDRPDQQNI